MFFISMWLYFWVDLFILDLLSIVERQVVQEDWCNVLCDYGWLILQESKGMAWFVSWIVCGSIGDFSIRMVMKHP